MLERRERRSARAVPRPRSLRRGAFLVGAGDDGACSATGDRVLPALLIRLVLAASIAVLLLLGAEPAGAAPHVLRGPAQSSTQPPADSLPLSEPDVADGCGTRHKITTSPTETSSISVEVAGALEPGRYEVLIEVSDEGPGRAGQNPRTQDREQVVVDFHSGHRVAFGTAATPDLADGVRSAEWKGSLGPVELDQGADRVVVRHAFPRLDTGAHSLNVDCVTIVPLYEVPIVAPEASLVVLGLGGAAAGLFRLRQGLGTGVRAPGPTSAGSGNRPHTPSSDELGGRR